MSTPRRIGDIPGIAHALPHGVTNSLYQDLEEQLLVLECETYSFMYVCNRMVQIKDLQLISARLWHGRIRLRYALRSMAT